jgi:predicted nucleotidyltransferase
MTETIRTVIEEARARLEREYGDLLSGVVLYGSHARGDSEPGSDVDLLVVLRGEVSATAEVSRLSEALAELSLRHDTVVSCVFVSEVRYRSEQSPFLLNVRREGIAA